ncbi:MAG: anaerobic sulfatase maturase [Alphaproteobacteria bacterium]|nr:anaerobic sulfatase maturase [Alphaproteobacteria bacterium]
MTVETAKRGFQVMAKPVGAVCNLDCGYCYYLEKKELYPKQSHRMADDLLQSYIAQHIEASPDETIFFSWHGGEPTLLGIDYFRRILEIQQRHCPEGREIRNGIQTNGTLIDEAWCRFLAAERFYVGLSIDGPPHLHDHYRVTKKAKATHRQVLQAFRLFKQHRIHCDLLCVVNDRNARQPAAVYRFFKEIGAEFLQFLPLVIRDGENGVRGESVPAKLYGEFLSAVFDEWVRNDVGRITIHNFEEALRPYIGLDHSLCVLRETCGDVVVVEHTGEFYSCDHFVEPDHMLGNILETPLVDLINGKAQAKFGSDKKDSLPRYCRDCEVLKSCNGGCPKDRFIQTPDGEDGLNYLCAGYKHFALHARPYLRRLSGLRKARLPASKIMDVLRGAEKKPAKQVGRNDPCPCGSGRKYKKCCLGNVGLPAG